jgi:hypothetical protein
MVWAILCPGVQVEILAWRGTTMGLVCIQKRDHVEGRKSKSTSPVPKTDMLEANSRGRRRSKLVLSMQERASAATAGLQVGSEQGEEERRRPYKKHRTLNINLVFTITMQDIVEKKV